MTAGTAADGEMQYALGTDATTAPDASAYTSSIPKATDAGTYYVYYYVKGDVNHNDTQVYGPLTCKIDQKSVTVSGITATDRIYNGGTDVTLVYTGVSFEGLIDGDVLSAVAMGSFSDKNVGEDKEVGIFNITLAGDSVANYKLAETGNQESTTATISPLEVVLEWDTVTSFDYDKESHVPQAFVANKVSGDDVSIVVVEAQKNVGVYTATAEALSGNDSLNYNLAEGYTHIFNIAKADVNVSVSIEGWTYGDEPSEPDVTIGEEGLVIKIEYKPVGAANSAYTETVPVNAGTYNIRVSVTGNRNYNDTTAVDSFTIEKKAATLEWDGAEFTYDGTDKCPTAVVTNLEDGDECVVSVVGDAAVAGTHTATAYKLSNNNYELPEDATFAFTIKKANLPQGTTPTPTSVTMDNWIYGDTASDPVVAYNISNGVVTYSYKVKDADDSTYTNVKPVKAGYYTVKAVIAETENYNGLTVYDDFTIDKRVAELAWGETEFVYDGSEFIPTCTITNLVSGDKVNVVLVAKNSLEETGPLFAEGMIDAGNYFAVVESLTGSDADNYELPEEAFTAFSIGKAEHELEITVEGWTYGEDANDPEVTANSDEEATIVYYIDEECTVKTDAENSGAAEEGGVPVKAGTYYVKATLVECDNYLADEAVAEFTIEKVHLHGIWVDEDFVYDGESYQPTCLLYRIYGDDDVKPVIYGSRIDAGVGVSVVTGLSGEDADNYVLDDVLIRTFTVLPAEVELSVTMNDYVYGDEIGEPEVTCDVEELELIVEYKLLKDKDSAYTTEVPTEAGDYVVRVRFVDNANYNAVVATENFTIAKKTVELLWDGAEFTYDGTDKLPTATVNNIVEGDECTVTVMGASATVGTHTATAYKLSNNNYELPENATFAFTIIKADLADAEVFIDNWTYLDSPKVPYVTGNTEGANVTYMYKVKDADDSTYTTTVPSLAGNYTIKAVIAATAGYNGAEVVKDFEIYKKAPTLTLSLEGWTYGDDANECVLTGNIEEGEVTYTYYLDEECTVKTTAENSGAAEEGAVPVDAGTYFVKADVAETANYLAGDATATFTIAKKAVTLTVNDSEKTYGNDDPEFTANAEGLVGEDTLNYEFERAEGENAGDYNVTAVLGENPNYDVTVADGTLTINKKAVILVVEDAEKIYGDDDPEFTANAEGLVGEDTLNYEFVRIGGEDVGQYWILVALGENPNYDVTPTSGWLTINKRPVTLTADALSKTYGDEDPELTATAVNVVEGETLNYTIARAEGENAGEYAVTITLGENPNYDITVTNGIFTINKRDVTLTADDKTKEFSDADPELTATATNLVGDDTLNYTLSRAEGEALGGYEISIVLGENPNYNVETIAGTFTIVPKDSKDITVTEAEAELDYDATPKKPELTVKNGEIVLEEGVDYDVTYVGTYGTEYEESADAPSHYGTYKAVITFKGNYTGEDKEVEFEIVRDLEIIRICGDNRFETSLESAEKLKEKLETEGKLVDGKFENIIVASGLDFADALSGSYLAAKKNAPVLLVADGKVMDAVVAYINENLAENGKVYILGGTGAVSATFEELLGADYADRIIRLGGADRYETNLLVLKEAGIEDGEDILVCDGTGFADSISVSGTGKAILLVPKDKLTSGEGYSQEAFLSELGGTHKFYVIGGEGAVSAEVEETLAELGETERVNGSDRFETSVAIMDKFYENPTSVTFVYAENFPDGISAGPLAYAFNEPVVLASNSNKAKELLNGYIGNKLDDVYLVHVFGGETLISDETIVDAVNFEKEESSDENETDQLPVEDGE
ncbi:MAG: cell wall-binding repeat-containing protein [Lachnospiraceae bacterium]|nr:cell wall-binding repeat-containing protein [Lachnospiraceae bacterium]